MNLPPEFSLKNTPEYSIADEVRVAKGPVPTGQRVVRSFDARVVWWAALTILAFWAFLEKPFLVAAPVSWLADWLLFAVGLMVGLIDLLVRQKRSAASPTPLWLRLLVIVAILVAALLPLHFLAPNNFFFSLCEGGVTGSAIWRAIAAYRDNWVAFS